MVTALKGGSAFLAQASVAQATLVEQTAPAVSHNCLLSLHKNELKKTPKDFKAISIMDEISEECWKYEFNSFRIDRNNYKKQVDHSTATFAFLESCWKGNGGAWEYAFT